MRPPPLIRRRCHFVTYYSPKYWYTDLMMRHRKRKTDRRIPPQITSEYYTSSFISPDRASIDKMQGGDYLRKSGVHRAKSKWSDRIKGKKP